MIIASGNMTVFYHSRNTKFPFFFRSFKEWSEISRKENVYGFFICLRLGGLFMLEAETDFEAVEATEAVFSLAISA